MNTGNVLQLADFIEKDKSFSMKSWNTCIAGLCYKMLTGVEADQSRSRRVFFDTVCGFLGISPDIDYPRATSRDLFGLSPEVLHISLYASRDKAVAMLREFAITGKVNWDAINAPAINTALPPFPEPVMKKNSFAQMFYEMIPFTHA